MQSDILFDNIYIGHSVSDAEKLKNATFDIKHKVESAEEEASKPPMPEPVESPSELSFMEDPVNFIRTKVDLFYTMARNDPVQAVKYMPEVAGGIGAVAATVIALLVALVSLGTSSSAPSAKEAQDKLKKAAEKAKDAATDAKDTVVDATTTGADKLTDSVSKRSTRSSGPAE